MCGIAGIWRFKEKLQQDDLVSFTDSMRHRGPDGAGYEVFEKDNLGLGHRRLSILDLSDAGKQPMSYADSRYWLTFNGEIYNFIEIRNELIAKGFQFRSDSDSEVVLAAYSVWGTECFKKFNGMWAIAIWDNKERQLLLCRDRFGVKPLHYTFIKDEVFAFASETIAFKHLKGFKRRYNETDLIHAMHEHNVLEPAGKTIYQHVKQLLPGSYMLVKNNSQPKEMKWWNTLENIPDVPKNFVEQKEQFYSLFADACKLRLRSDVSIASALSGGIDSTAVYCMLTHVMKNSSSERIPGDWQKAFSIAFPGSDVDERKYIESVLKQTHGNGIIVEAKNDDLVKELQQSTATSDLISGTPLACLTYVYKAMRANNIVVSMDGHGVDEYLYGYNTSVSKALLQAYISENTEDAKDFEDTLIQMNFPGKGQKLIAEIRKKSADKKDSSLTANIKKLFAKKKQVSYKLNAQLAGGFYKKEVLEEICDDSTNYFGINNNRGEQQLLEEFHYIDMPYNLRDFDRGAMQHHIEIRMPFMDYRLVSFAFGLPQKSKLNNGFTKYILRECMKGIMPEDIRTRKLKIGLGAPLTDWFNGPLNTFLLDLSHSKKLSDSMFLDAKLIRETIETNCRNKTWNNSGAGSTWPVINYLLLNEN
jgi:asparagine synthase (glutamine-hydrolysing)